MNPNATQSLGLALRELCDNALKHGAFSKAGGEVSILWQINTSEAEPTLEMTWRERGYPLVKPATTSGVRHGRYRASHRRRSQCLFDIEFRS